MFALFRLGFPTLTSNDLGLHAIITRWLIIQKVRHHPTVQFMILYANGDNKIRCRTKIFTTSISNIDKKKFAVIHLILYRRKAMRLKTRITSQKSPCRIKNTTSLILSRTGAFLNSHHLYKNHKLNRLGSDSL